MMDCVSLASPVFYSRKNTGEASGTRQCQYRADKALGEECVRQHLSLQHRIVHFVNNSRLLLRTGPVLRFHQSVAFIQPRMAKLARRLIEERRHSFIALVNR